MNVTDKQFALRAQAIFFVVLSVAILSVYALNYLLNLFPQDTSNNINAFVRIFQSCILPEPIERNIFLILVPTLSMLIFFLAKYQSYFDKVVYLKSVATLLPLIMAILLLSPFHRSDVLLLLVSNKLFFVEHDYAVWFFSLSIAILCCIMIWRSQYWETSTTARTITWSIFIIAMLTQLFSWRIASINSVSYEAKWVLHADIVFYSLSQVLAGKTLLVDLPSQYGLFSELLYPLFKLFKPSVLALTKFFAILQVISLLGLFYVLSKLVRNSTLLLLGGISLLFVTFCTFIYFLKVFSDPYYQYWPIRFFWPAFSVLTFYYFSCHKTLLRGALVSLVSAIGIFWNMDTGLFIFLSFAVYLGTQIILIGIKNKNHRWLSIKKNLAALGLHLLITSTVIGFLLGMMWIKAQQPLQLHWPFAYQKYFFGMGFAMMPLPRDINPWMSVLSIYALGIILTLATWFQRAEEDIRLNMVLYLSLLGIGLFVYYQGRSHPFNLIHVCWPAVLIITVAADSILKKIQDRNLPFTYIALPIAAIAFLSICSINFFAHMPKMWRDTAHLYKTRKVKSYPLYHEELAFIKSHAPANHECLILAQRQGIYYLESGLASPLKGVGSVMEIILQEEQDRILSQIMQGKIDCIFFGTGASRALFFPYHEKKMRKIYHVAAESNWHTMLYLTRKNKNSSLPDLSQFARLVPESKEISWISQISRDA